MTMSMQDHGIRESNQSPPGLEHHDVNVGHSERVVSTVGGGALLLLGLQRRSIPGALAAVLGASLIRRGWTGHCPAYSAMNRDTAHDHHAAEPEDFHKHGVHVEQTFTINKPAEELYAFWRNLENLPHFMEHLKSVKVLDEKRSHWVAKAPAGYSVEWDAEIINDEPNKLIAWRSTENAQVASAGSVRFIPLDFDRGTEVKVVLDYLPPAGQLGRYIAKLFGEEPEQQVREDLRHFKQLMETGEIPTIEGQPQGA